MLHTFYCSETIDTILFLAEKFKSTEANLSKAPSQSKDRSADKAKTLTGEMAASCSSKLPKPGRVITFI